MNKKKSILTIVLVILLTAGTVIGGTVYKTRFRPVETVTGISPDGLYTLRVCMLGEPDFPFGATHCRAELTEGGKTVTRFRFDVLNDGKTVDETNFSIRWYDGKVTLDVNGEEMTPVSYDLFFDGKIDTVPIG